MVLAQGSLCQFHVSNAAGAPWEMIKNVAPAETVKAFQYIYPFF